ncbi:MAG: YdcF family protein [Brumimicrobium sp.]|nr:YdcF family protein [Brumimicrobium sp.]
MKIIRLLIFVPLSILILLGVLGLWADYKVSDFSKGKNFNQVDDIPYNKVGLVLGTSKYRVSGGINLYFKYRIDAAVELFNHGKIDFILVSGDNSTPSYNEPKQFMEELIKRGIPKEKIFLDYAGFRTLDSMIRAYKVFGQHSITVISQKFHNERAIYLAEHNDMKTIGFNAKDVTKSYGFKTMIREYLARIRAILDVWFKTQPKFLGKEIIIA